MKRGICLVVRHNVDGEIVCVVKLLSVQLGYQAGTAEEAIYYIGWNPWASSDGVSMLDRVSRRYRPIESKRGDKAVGKCRVSGVTPCRPG